MQRIGQPAVIGQLLAGIILGPSVFGTIWPAGHQAVFPPNSSNRQMLNAVSELGVLLLTLDGNGDRFGAGQARRPHGSHHVGCRNRHPVCVRLHARRNVASECVARSKSPLVHLALSRNCAVHFLGENCRCGLARGRLSSPKSWPVILAAAILDDTIGWTILALIGGVAAKGAIVIGPVLVSILVPEHFSLFASL